MSGLDQKNEKVFFHIDPVPLTLSDISHFSERRVENITVIIKVAFDSSHLGL